MVTTLHNTEYRFVVPGKAESFRTQAAKKYKHKIIRIAKEIFPQPLDKRVEVRINYFHYQPRRMDMDNIAKCVMDALNGIAYRDDKQVSFQRSCSHSLKAFFQLMDEPVDIIKPLATFDEYVIVRIREANA